MNTDTKIKSELGGLCARVGVFLAFCFLFFGCSGGPLVPVEGIVTLDDKPVEGAVIQFSPVGRGQIATGSSDASGKFVMTTKKDGDGAMPGKYRVAVTKSVFGAVDVTPPDPSQPLVTDPTTISEAARKAEEAKRKSGIPEVYWNSGTSPLTVDIPEGGDTNVELKLESTAK